jgi:ribosomal protein S18 acetylase RimI-like enzyme
MLEDYATVIEERQVIVAAFGGTVAGVIVLAASHEGFLLENVAVLPDHRGSGLGKALLQYAESEARRQGFGSLYLYTHEKMTENQRLYSKIGYVKYDRREEHGFARVYMQQDSSMTLPSNSASLTDAFSSLRRACGAAKRERGLP